jgi:hypothetical protein
MRGGRVADPDVRLENDQSGRRLVTHRTGRTAAHGRISSNAGPRLNLRLSCLVWFEQGEKKREEDVQCEHVAPVDLNERTDDLVGAILKPSSLLLFLFNPPSSSES